MGAIHRSDGEGTNRVEVAKYLGIHVNQINHWRSQIKREIAEKTIKSLL